MTLSQCMLPRWVPLIFLSVLIAGCSSKLPPKANADEARTALTTVLESWKRGERLTELANRQPAVYYNDAKYSPDLRLVNFTIDDTHEDYGQSVRLSAVLQIRMKDGSIRDRKTRYTIDTSPVMVIVAD